MNNRITIRDLDEIDNKILFALIEKDRLPQEVLKIAYPEVNKLIKKKKKLEDIYRDYSQKLSRRGKGHLWKLKELELIQERVKKTSKTEPYKINNVGIILEMLKEITMLDLNIEKYRVNKLYIVKRKGQSVNEYNKMVRNTQKALVKLYHDKLKDLKKKGFKKDAFVEELAKQMYIKDTFIIDSFVKAKKTFDSFDSFNDFVKNFILFLGQWDENTFLTKIIYQSIEDNQNKTKLAQLIAKKFWMLLDFQKRCHQYYLKKYKSPMESFDIDLFPREI